MAEDDRVRVLVVPQRPVQPPELRRPDGPCVVPARVGGVEADADDVVGDAEAVVLGARVQVGRRVAVPDRAVPPVRRLQVGPQVLPGRERGPALVGCDRAHRAGVGLEEVLEDRAPGVLVLLEGVLELLGVGRRDVHQLLAADGEVGQVGVAVRGVGAERHRVVVADRRVPGDVQAGAAQFADRGGQVALDVREAELLVGVADAVVGLPVELQAAALDALVPPGITGVRGDPAAAHHRQEPLQFGSAVVVRVVAGGHGEVQRGAGDGAAAQRVDPLDERHRARHGQRLLRPPGVHVRGAQVLQPERVLGVDQVQIGELDEGGERRTPVRAPRLRRGQVLADDPPPAGAVAQAAVAGTAGRGGDVGEGRAPGVRGERHREPAGGADGRLGGGGAGARRGRGARGRGARGRGGLAVGGPQGVADARGEGHRPGRGEQGPAVDPQRGAGDRAYARHARSPRVRTRRQWSRAFACAKRPAHQGSLAPGVTCA